MDGSRWRGDLSPGFAVPSPEGREEFKHAYSLPHGEGGPCEAWWERSFSAIRDGNSIVMRLKPMKHSSPLTFARAKHMRCEPTEAERRLWGALRGKRLGGLKFYRQVPIGPYIVDFLNQEHGVVIEVDGVTHGDAHEVVHDQCRTAFLEARGLKVHRVYNSEVYCHLSNVLDGIYAVVTERATKGPHPSCASRNPPSPEGKGR